MEVLSDDEFVTIDLGEDFEECDICHQATEEAIIHVVLDDLFTIYDGSYEKRSGRLTKTHQVCLDRWSDIIKRNLKSSKHQTFVKNYINTSPNQKNCRNDRSPHRTTSNENSLISKRTSYEHNTLQNKTIEESNDCNKQGDCIVNDKDVIYNDEIKGKCLYDDRCLITSGRCSCSKDVGRKSPQELNSSTTKDISKWIDLLKGAINGTSQTLVEQLQLRDKLSQEVSGQKSLIAQLIKKRQDVQTNSPSVKRHSIT